MRVYTTTWEHRVAKLAGVGLVQGTLKESLQLVCDVINNGIHIALSDKNKKYGKHTLDHNFRGKR